MPMKAKSLHALVGSGPLREMRVPSVVIDWDPGRFMQLTGFDVRIPRALTVQDLLEFSYARW